MGSHTLHGSWLLYVGISPKMPTADGRLSRQNLRTRLRYHYRGNAAGSTLRLTLGCLLSETLGIELQRVGSRDRLTFGAGEARLTEWLALHARVTWVTDPEPWLVEDYLIRTESLRLNLQGNTHHPFRATLSGIRGEARARARAGGASD
jgi:hypothetical protein